MSVVVKWGLIVLSCVVLALMGGFLIAVTLTRYGVIQ